MNKTILLLLFLFAELSHAALVGRDFDGDISTVEAYYDTEQDITWLADANAAAGSIYDDGASLFDGRMTGTNANAWISSLTIEGYSNWRLPTTLQPDPTCSTQGAYGSRDFNCTGSEMGHLYYINGISVSSPGIFSNIVSATYWSATDHVESGTDGAWAFNFVNGATGSLDRDLSIGHAWAVHDGDIGISIVPIPTAIWLFGSGLIGLVGFARRKNA